MDRPHQIVQYLADERKAFQQIRTNGLVVSAHRFDHQPGVIAILDGHDISLLIDALEDCHSFCREILTLDFQEITEIEGT